MQLDKKISGVTGDLPQDRTFSQALANVAGLAGRMERENRANYILYGEQDRELVFFTFLFEIFHAFMDDFDRHILAQVAAGNKVLPVNFANKAFALFKKRGGSRGE